MSAFVCRTDVGYERLLFIRGVSIRVERSTDQGKEGAPGLRLKLDRSTRPFSAAAPEVTSDQGIFDPSASGIAERGENHRIQFQKPATNPLRIFFLPSFSSGTFPILD